MLRRLAFNAAAVNPMKMATVPSAALIATLKSNQNMTKNNTGSENVECVPGGNEGDRRGDHCAKSETRHREYGLVVELTAFQYQIHRRRHSTER